MSNHVEHACPHEGCGHMVCMSKKHEDRLRETHESFYCPAGHSMSFNGPSKQEREIKALRRAVETRDSEISSLRYALDLRDTEIRSLRSKLAWRERWLRLRDLAKVAG